MRAASALTAPRPTCHTSHACHNANAPTTMSTAASAKDTKGGSDAGDSQIAGKIQQLTDDLAKERVMRLRAEVAAEKKLTAAQAKRLNGSSREELEADADELLEAFPASSSSGTEDGKGGGDGGDTGGRPPSRRPAADLSGGSNPDDGQEKVETDPAKLASSVPRF